jgi:Ca-activated chloride channel family protein
MIHRVLLACLVLLAFGAAAAFADAGVVTAFVGDEEQPAGSLTLARLEIRVRLDHGMARVEMLQVLESHVDRPLEARFQMTLPEAADIDGFAVWDDLTRIPGVIIEKAKARRLFRDISRATIDPGLLAADEEPSLVNEFSTRVAPIPPFGAKRIELSYRAPAPIERGLLDFVLSLAPTGEGALQAGKLVIDIEAADDLPLENLTFHGAHLTPAVTRRDAQSFAAHFEADDAPIDEDLAFTAEYKLGEATVDLVAWRDADEPDWNLSPTGGMAQDAAGYWLARVMFPPRAAADVGARQVILVVDGSLSMLGDKLARVVELTGALARQLAPTDAVTLLYANTETQATAGPPQPATPAWLATIEDFLRRQTLAGGLDLAGALGRAGALCVPGQSCVVLLLSDGRPTAGELRHGPILEAVKRSPLATAHARLFAIGVGDDANRTLLSDLAAAADGAYAWCADGADTAALAKTVTARMSAAVMRRIELWFGRRANIVDAYPAAIPATFAGSEAAVVGRYAAPGADTVTVRWQPDGAPPQEKTVAVELPAKQTDHEGLRRRWAKARVDYLVERIRREGEKQEWIDEIVALSKRFTFVTPYTSFLAAPRALLRPRVIRPGDPLLRVRAAADIVAIAAIFPFGLTAPLTYLEDEDIWQVRFLAPPGFPDGEYVCQLILTDREGRQYVEAKAFVLDSRAPTVRPAMNKKLPAGGKARIAVFADADTRRLSARLPFTASASLRWDAAAKANVGYLEIPEGAPLGPAKLEIYAEDFAFNVSRTMIDVEVVREP